MTKVQLSLADTFPTVRPARDATSENADPTGLGPDRITYLVQTEIGPTEGSRPISAYPSSLHKLAPIGWLETSVSNGRVVPVCPPEGGYRTLCLVSLRLHEESPEVLPGVIMPQGVATRSQLVSSSGSVAKLQWFACLLAAPASYSFEYLKDTPLLR